FQVEEFIVDGEVFRSHRGQRLAERPVKGHHQRGEGVKAVEDENAAGLTGGSRAPGRGKKNHCTDQYGAERLGHSPRRAHHDGRNLADSARARQREGGRRAVTHHPPPGKWTPPSGVWRLVPPASTLETSS